MNGFSVAVLRQLHEDARERRCRVRWLDLHLADGLTRRQTLADGEAELLALAAALLSYQLGQGEVCLDLRQLPAQPFGYEGECPLDCGRLTPVQLQGLPCVGTPGDLQPLILDGERLYLHKYWRYERQVRDALLRRAQLPAGAVSTNQRRLLQALFSNQVSDQAEPAEPDWQAIAVAVALQRSLAVITGGPGTGKTTTVTKLLAVLTALDESEAGQTPLKVIKLVAPTGKAAARLTESIRAAKQKLGLTPEQAARIPDQAATLHRLLGPLPNGAQFRHHRDNPLHLDVLVLDEASMVDLPMMAKLLDALPPHARLILLGDPEQLASVEAGSVLADIVNESRELGYSEALRASICELTGIEPGAMEVVWGELTATASPLRDSLCRLRKSHRFQQGIGRVAQAINRQDWNAFTEAVEAAEEVVCNPLKAGQIQQLVRLAADSYKPYRQLVREGATPDEILRAFEQCRVLAAVREGVQGVTALNKAIEASLFGHPGQWYSGRPVLVTRNDYNLNLYNGDIGITLECPERKQLRVYFVQPDGVRDFAISRLPEHETVFAMTIHKSQGSEFGHSILVLPEQDSELLTKELLYTGVTRAKERCTLFAGEEILRAAIARRTQRASGLRDLLWNGF